MKESKQIEQKKETAVATNGTRTIRGFLEGDNFRQQVTKALPKHLKADRFIRIAVTALTRTPKLKECDSASFFKCLLDLSQLGIEPDGRRAHLIPFRNNKRGCMECQLIIDYKGLVELVMRSGNVANIHADVVCENDAFEYNKGEVIAHRIDFRKPRGEAYAAYSICTFKDGTQKAEVMSFDEIEAVRNQSRAGKSGPWVTHWNEMAKKTVFRRLSKWVTLSPEYRDVIDTDADTPTALDVESHPVEQAEPSDMDMLAESLVSDGDGEVTEVVDPETGEVLGPEAATVTVKFDQGDIR